jgi:N,N-dimethylformamidase beta subunit-like, C-terminal
MELGLAEIDTFSQSEAVQSVVFRTSGLAAGPHSLVIEATGRRNALSTNNYVVVDAFDLSPSPIITENQLPGSPNWQMWLNGYRPATDAGKQIKGYASATSVNKGGSISFHVTVSPAQAFSIDVYRMGWYQGLGGRLMQHIGPINGVQQPDCPVDGTTGLIECPWPASYTLNVPGTWTSGVFLAQLTNEQGYQNYIIFVVRDDARRADILYQQAVNTYQAYNNYPNDGITGKGLYDYNSYGPNTITGAPRAAKLSFNRPYTGNGSGHFLLYEYFFVRWMERSGYDVTYSTDIDNHQNGARLLNSRAFLSVGHDEYWSKQMYDAAEQARDYGIHLGFFEANAVYWQVRFEPSPMTGVADRVMVGYKDSATDPVQGPTTTVQWRSAMINRPEQRLMGVQYLADHSGDLPNAAYVVANSSNWVYAGTGLADGSSIPGIVGYEVDSSSTAAPLPASIPGTYAVLSQSPFYDDGTGQTVIANSSVYEAPSGAWVFGAGTICWSWGLDNPGVADARIQRITANVLNRFLGVSMQ